ncbi:dihydrofolate reductase-like domain-containing protein [Rhypophila decipiens]|uniref:Dihydrofolate reductase n=1 Tax=Rhypophila decipiens TaxID=261697 RepID=A0AAN6YGC3_9PEZI|nr:dihydrofolate reductase-like domain-containing protein [Rhypophila decipiens]
MPPPAPLELTLVLAATRDMGIGLHGGLPWTGLKKEMAYFARVTKRIPPSPSSSSSLPSQQDGTAPPAAAMKNAVIMGRKTWDSIPPRFRPLKGRLNVVISRSAASLSPSQTSPGAGVVDENEKKGDNEVIMAPSLEQALSYLGERRTNTGKIFVIGGGQIYGAALKSPQTKRILLTRVLSDFECDTFFPLVLGDDNNNNGGEWKRSSKENFDDWVGENVPEGVQEENGTRYEFQMWER